MGNDPEKIQKYRVVGWLTASACAELSEVHDLSYYGKCMVGGVLSCGVTHTAVCPLDVAKCKMQTDNSLKDLGLGGTIKRLRASHGSTWMTLGWAPTAIGYSM
jgi:solute carrier family 25 phosphate transporter 3